MKIMKPAIFIMAMLPIVIHAQILTGFDNGNTSLSGWFGTPEKFIVNSKEQLQLQDTAAGTAWLSTANYVNGSNEWKIWVKEAFSPSSNNYVRIYLLTDKKNLTQPLNGYFLQLGEKGRSDAIELFRQDANQISLVCRGTNGLIASSFAIRIKVIRDHQGNWKILADPSGGESFIPQAIGYDNHYDKGAYFGIYCAYTTSNDKKIYFDDIYSGAVIRDTVPPEIKAIRFLNKNELSVTYNEIMDSTTVGNSTHYILSPGGKHPDKVALLTDEQTVLLYFDNPFQNKSHYSLKIDSVTDLSGNYLFFKEYAIDYYFAEPYDVVINEIMADPTPSQGLSKAEYLELYNTTDFTIDLTNWNLQIGNKIHPLNQVLIKAGGYLLLTATQNISSFQTFGPVYGISGFYLLNAGQTLKLSDTAGAIISEVSYKKSWYKNNNKDNGGWSLEQMNPKNSCSGSENWTASINSEGGTPGKVNSVFDTVVFYPKIQAVQVKNSRNLEAIFNQKMDIKSLTDTRLWFADTHPDTVRVSNDSLNKADLFFSNPFAKSKKYSLKVSRLVHNCRGLSIKADTTVFFGIPEPIKEKEILFNEVLAKPKTGGAEYIEVVNHSDKISDLGTLKLGILKNKSDGTIDTVFYDISNAQKLIFPGEYYVLTPSPDKVKQQYFTENPENFIMMSSFPTLTNNSGTILLKTVSGQRIDEFTYNENMHYALLKKTDGVSLERIDLNRATDEPGNWHSASEDYGFGTPTYRNSQFYFMEDKKITFSIQPKIFSPDGDGIDDKANIGYRLDKSGYSVQISVFNSSGALIRHLYNNEYLGTSGTLYWDGKTDRNTKAVPGIYIISIQLFNVDGTTRRVKKTVVLAPKR